MRFLPYVFLAALFATAMVGCSSEQEEAVDNQISLLNNVADRLEKIKSNIDVVDAKSDLEKLAAKMRDLGTRIEKMEGSDEEYLKVLEAKGDKLERAQARVKDQMERIAKDVGPGAMMQVGSVLGDAMESGPTGGSAGGSARGDTDAARNASSGSTSASASPLQREAEAFVQRELANRWLQQGDVWTSEIPIITQNIMGGNRQKVGTYFLQLRAPKYTVDASEVSEANRLNGLEYIGSVDFESPLTRTYGKPDMMGTPDRNGWSKWETSYQSITINKRDGEWILDDDEFVSGEKPTNVPA